MDGNSSITREEISRDKKVAAIFAMTGDTGGDNDVTTQVNTNFGIMDTDGNGQLSREEFMEGARQDERIVEAFTAR